VVAIAAALIVAAAVVWAALHIASRQAAGDSRREERTLAILTAFAPAIEAVQQSPRALIVWQPLARAARALYPEEFAALDRVAGATFPFPAARIEAAHAQWTSEWLAWERAHDAEFKRKAVEAEHDASAADPSVRRARLDAIERDKLDLYQRRYEDYIKVAKALQSLTTS